MKLRDSMDVDLRGIYLVVIVKDEEEFQAEFIDRNN